MSYRIAGIDVHKKMHALVMTDVSEGGEYTFERRVARMLRELRSLGYQIDPVQLADGSAR